jgi:signal peptidase II
LWRIGLKKYLIDYGTLFLIAGIVVLLDQWSKELIRNSLTLGEVYRPDLWLSQYARIVHWQNSGAAFGIFQQLGGIFMILSIIVSVVIIYYFPQVPRDEWIIRLAMGLLLGGALGNLLDRLMHQGFVTDFLSVGDFPVFNVADASISIGVVVLFIGMWLQERRKKDESSNQNNPDSSASGSLPEERQGE